MSDCTSEFPFSFQIEQNSKTSDFRTKGKLFRKRRDITKIVDGFELAAKECRPNNDLDCTNYDYFPEDESYDVSVFAKMGENKDAAKE